MLHRTLALLAAGLLVVGCNGADNKPADSKKDMKAPSAEKDKPATDAKAAAPVQYQELQQNNATWVVGTAEGAAAVKAGKKPPHVMSVMGGKKVYFEQDKDGKLAANLMAEYDKRHAKKQSRSALGG